MQRRNGRLHMRRGGDLDKRPTLPKLSGTTYYWIWGRDCGRRVVWGPFESHHEATDKALMKLSSDFEIVPLRTRDQATASRILRSRVLDETGDFDETFKNFKHQL